MFAWYLLVKDIVALPDEGEANENASTENQEATPS
jgi:hypothetical protein